MALRVLLADESTTIKKVMQLALQDFAVDVKAVHSGLDVAEVARSFQPDIVFADVLLAKRNGYDVTAELKSDANLGEIPVVLMWSSFMDIDEAAFTRSKANQRLEKPFDVETLRSLVKELVPKTQTQRLAHFLKFPADFVEPLAKEESQKQATAKTQQGAPGKTAPVAPPSQTPTPKPAPQASPPPIEMPPLQMAPSIGSAPSASYEPPPSLELPELPSYAPPELESEPEVTAASALQPSSVSEQKSTWNMESFEPLPDITSELLNDFNADEDEDEPVKITKLGSPEVTRKAQLPELAPKPSSGQSDEGDPWSHQNLSRFKLDIPEQDVEKDEISLVFDMNQVDEPKADEFLLKRTDEVTRPTAKIPPSRLLNDESHTQPQIDIDTSGIELESIPDEPESAFDSHTHRYSPIGEVLHGEDVISQFAGEHVEPLADLSLEEDPNDHPIPVSAGTPIEYTPSYQPTEYQSEASDLPPQMSVDQIERIIRAQSQEVIEAIVRKIVPELATEIIKKELERLLADDDLTSRTSPGTALGTALGTTPKGRKS